VSVIPKAYFYVPGGTTGAVHIAGIRAFLAVSTYWSEVSFVSNLLTISNKTLPYVITVQVLSSSLTVRFSHDGLLFSDAASVTSTNTFASTNYGAGTDVAWIVETEDSLSWYSRATGSATTQSAPYLGALGFCFSVGKILTPDNRSDLVNNIGVFGQLAGFASIYLGGGSAIFALNVAATGSQFLRGSTWEDVRVQTSFVRAWNPTAPATFPETPNRRYSAAMGDADQTERLPPIRIMGVTSGTTCNTRYWRARYFPVNAVDSSGLIESTSVRVSSADPNIAWRHSAHTSLTSGGSASFPHNTIYLWSPTTTAL
jgi:hypothetical protein